jgi:hypothetical protein
MKIQKIWFDNDRIYGLTDDGRTLFQSLLYYRRLRNATEEERPPTKLTCSINYHNQDGETETQILQSGVETNPNVVDYILLAEDFKFPTATYGLTESEALVTLDVTTKVSAPEIRSKKFTRTMRIDCIMLVPHGIANVNEERFEIAPHGDGDIFQWLKY